MKCIYALDIVLLRRLFFLNKSKSKFTYATILLLLLFLFCISNFLQIFLVSTLDMEHHLSTEVLKVAWQNPDSQQLMERSWTYGALAPCHWKCSPGCRSLKDYPPGTRNIWLAGTHKSIPSYKTAYRYGQNVFTFIIQIFNVTYG